MEQARKLLFIWFVGGRVHARHAEPSSPVIGHPPVASAQMSEFDDRTLANMDVVLEEVCRELLHGGDHESRKFIAGLLMEAARAGQTTLGGLTAVGRGALLELFKGRSVPNKR